MGNGQVDFGDSSSDENERRDGEGTPVEVSNDAGYWSLWGPQTVVISKRPTTQGHEATPSKRRRLIAGTAEQSIKEESSPVPAASPDIVEIVKSAPRRTGHLELLFHTEGNRRTLTVASVKALAANGVLFLEGADFEAIPSTNLTERAKWCEERSREFEDAAKIIVRKRKEGLISCHVCPLCKRHVRGTKLAYILIHFENTHWKRMKCMATSCDRRKFNNGDRWHYIKGKDRFASALCPDHRPAQCACCDGKTKKKTAS